MAAGRLLERDAGAEPRRLRSFRRAGRAGRGGVGVSFPLHVIDALHARKSVRAFKPDPVPRELVEELLTLASRAPSGTNIQPWKVHVVAGAVRRRLEAEVLGIAKPGRATTARNSRAPASARSLTSGACASSARTCTP
ncbi:MAG: nitroreductase family protein [Rhizomicrobium sp.]